MSGVNWLPVHDRIMQMQKQCTELMLYGGAGSSKTWTHLRTIGSRALLMPGSRHGLFRKRFEHAKGTLWVSARDLINAQWPGLYDKLTPNRSGGAWSLTFPNGAEMIFGGLDDKERIEKHLGAEYASVYLNEVSEILNEADVDLIFSRLRQKIDGRHLGLMDMNPPTKNHWSYRRCIKPDEGKAIPSFRGAFKINPIDVKENLPASYIERLMNLPKRLRDRFWKGDFLSDVEGALWNLATIEGTHRAPVGEGGEIGIGLDPSATGGENADECGIVVAQAVDLGDDTGAHVLADLSKRCTPREWATIVVHAFDKYDADFIVAETNQGGDMVEDVIRQTPGGRNIPIRKVHAKRGKHLRAEPVAHLYERSLITHEADGSLDVLENQMQEWVPGESPDSPDRIDALVYVLRELGLSERVVPDLTVFG